MTIAAWTYPTTLGIAAAIVSAGVASGSNRNHIQLAPFGTFRIFSVGSSGTFSADGPSTVSQNTWHHLAGVFESTASRTAYVDGSAGTTTTTNCGSQATANSIVIGARWQGWLANYYRGGVAEVGIWNVALTAAEIASLAKGMTCDKIRPQSLVFYAPLVRDLIDAKGGLTITNNNGATVANHPRVYA
jgi:hypothetical protein